MNNPSIPSRHMLPQAGCSSGEPCDCVTSRRRFLEQATTISFGALTLTLLRGPAQPPSAPAPQFGFLVDTEKCIGSGKCLTACRVENNVPEGYSRTWVERYVHYKDGTVKVDLVPETGFADAKPPEIDSADVLRAYFVPKLCNHCDEAPCNQVCPVHASITSPEGFELVDAQRCIGCGYCVQACPYGSRFMNPNTGVADKCTWCYHRVQRNEQPACVEACPVGARLFGRLDDPNSDISKRLAAIPTQVLKAHLGTLPKTQYVGISSEVI